MGDRQAMAAAVRAFLVAAGVPAEGGELEGTPDRVAEAWDGELLDGYRCTAREALGELSPVPDGGGPILVTHLDYTGVCPHHLLPYRGLAHVAYRPGTKVVGFGRMAVLVDTFAHRLVLQEELAQGIAQALVAELGARSVAVLLDAEQSCMTMRGERRVHSRALVEASAGAADADLAQKLWLAAKGSAR